MNFYYDDATHWAVSDEQDDIITVPGDFQSELGLLRKLRAEFGEAEAQPAMQEAAE